MENDSKMNRVNIYMVSIHIFSIDITHIIIITKQSLCEDVEAC